MSEDLWEPSEPFTASSNDPIVHGLRWRKERDAARSALRDILNELSNGVTANWDYIAKRFAEGLDDTNVSV